MNTATSRNPFCFASEEPRKSPGRLILPKPRNAGPRTVEPGVQPDNTPQAYVPYASPTSAPARREVRRYAPSDNAMLPIAIVGMALSFFLGLPVGIFTGPSALRRAREVERHIRAGTRPPSDHQQVTATRVSAWMSIAVSIPLLIMWLVIAVALLMVAA